MVDENDHSACVDAWMEGAAKGLPPERLLRLFEEGFGVLWRRAHQTLGEVTLTAIVDRVLSTATEQFPHLAPLKVEATGIRFEDLREHAASLQQDQLAEGIRFVLVEFLTILGNLTSDILTPALHSELLKVAPKERGPDENESRGEPQDAESNGEDPDS